MNRAWMWLVVARLFEVGWAIGLKALPVGTGYAVWTGLGAVGTAIAGVVLFGESRELGRALSVRLIVAGSVGLKISSR